MNKIHIKDIKDDLINKKIIIRDIFRPFNLKPHSYLSAKAFILKDKIKNFGIDADIAGLDIFNNLDDYDIIFNSAHDNVYDYYLKSGKITVFDGFEEKRFKAVNNFFNFKGDIYCIDNIFLDYIKEIKRRLSLNIVTESWKTFDVQNAQNITNKIILLDTLYNSGNYVLGDSHSYSVYKPFYDIINYTGKTLYGALKEGLNNLLPNKQDFNNIIFYFGNIDIRHHLCRINNPIKELEILLDEYIKQVNNINSKNKYIVYPLPIEHEDRKLPKTGYYKGKPFFGSLEDRSKLVEFMKDYLDKIENTTNIKIIKWPDNWYKMDPAEFADKYMEKPRSVHLSQNSFIYKINDYIEDIVEEKSPKKLKLKSLF